MRTSVRLSAAGLVAAAVLSLIPASAFAHGGREVGEYHFTVGFFGEPAYEGEKNGVDLRIEDHDEEPVEGAEETLQVEIRHVDGSTSLTLPLRAVFNTPGRYTADFVPTLAGAYTFRFFGAIGDQQVDESFTSEVDSFSSVQPIADLQFPERVASGRELQAAITGAAEAAGDADKAASAAATRANIALGAGILGVLVGIGGVAVGMRKR